MGEVKDEYDAEAEWALFLPEPELDTEKVGLAALLVSLERAAG